MSRRTSSSLLGWYISFPSDVGVGGLTEERKIKGNLGVWVHHIWAMTRIKFVERDGRVFDGKLGDRKNTLHSQFTDKQRKGEYGNARRTYIIFEMGGLSSGVRKGAANR